VDLETIPIKLGRLSGQARQPSNLTDTLTDTALFAGVTAPVMIQTFAFEEEFLKGLSSVHSFLIITVTRVSHFSMLGNTVWPESVI